MNTNGRQKSRLPVLNKTTVITTTVTPAKLEKKKNNNNTLFATTCSRRAQELKNYNNKPNSNRLSFTFSFSKMSRPSSKTLTVDRKGKPTSVGVTTTTKRKSPLVQLQENLESLKQKNAEDENLVKKQSKEIAKLKKLLVSKAELNKTARPQKGHTDNKLQIELGQQLVQKQKLQTQIDSITKQVEELQASVVDQLEVAAIAGDTPFSNKIKELQMQLESNEEGFKKQLTEYQILINQKEYSIQQQQKTINQKKSDYANQIVQLNLTHRQAIDTLQTQLQRDLIDLKQKLNHQKSHLNMDAALEQVLLEFEQKQHNHAPPKPLVYQGLQHKMTTHRQINQQWYTQQYMPINALSWPSPQPLPNLKRQLQTR